MRAGDAPLRGAGRAITAELSAKKPKPKLSKVLPEVWKLVVPRKWLIAGSFCLMIVNRLCSLVLPISSRPFINDVMRQGKMTELPKIIGAVAGAVFLQAVTSYALTQLLSKRASG
jgi:ABC-type multidrug transport system fused ATPase/permease subunit